MRLQDLIVVTNTPLDMDGVLLEKFRNHDRVQYDAKTDLYSYKVHLSLVPLLAMLTLDMCVYSMSSTLGTRWPY